MKVLQKVNTSNSSKTNKKCVKYEIRSFNRKCLALNFAKCLSFSFRIFELVYI